jgi:S1-C subfamily serine protease
VAVVVIAMVFAAFIGLSIGRQVHQRLSVTTPQAQPFFNPNANSGSSSAGVSSQVQAVASKVDRALVDINTRLAYQGAEAAGTGMILTSSGEVLTNNHVISGATTITATSVDTGKTYTAKVVGTDPTDDVAVIQLQGASGLPTISTGDPAKLSQGDNVIAIGNAGGVGGTPSVVTGTVQALNQSITASNGDGSGAEQLTGLIETDAPIQPGDSGGPLVNSSGQVIGMDTAASSGTRFFSQASVGFAIPIDKALSIAKQIESGQPSSKVEIGVPGFLGVQVQPGVSGSVPGAVIGGVEAGSPAEKAGLAAGDVITSVNGTSVDSADTLTRLLHTHHPGDKVSIGWVDANGGHHTATATLITGPAD